MTKDKSPRVLAREKRDEALHKLGEKVYREWITDGRDLQGDMRPGAMAAELKAVDDACAAVALQ